MKALQSFGFVFCVMTLLCQQSCKDDDQCMDETKPECKNYNPCWNQKRVTADFEMSQIYGFVLPDYVGQFNADVAFPRGDVGFRPVNYDKNAKYKWILGSEVITDATFVRDFEGTTENDILITLIIEKEPDLSCFPNDDGKDTITKYIHFVESPCEYLTNGDFKVLFEGEKDSVIVSVRNWFQASSGPQNPIDDSCRFFFTKLIGFNRQKLQPDTLWDASSRYQFNSKLYFNDAGVTGNTAKGYMKVDFNNWKVEARYKVYLGNNEFSQEHKFYGRKIK